MSIKEINLQTVERVANGGIEEGRVFKVDLFSTLNYSYDASEFKCIQYYYYPALSYNRRNPKC